MLIFPKAYKKCAQFSPGPTDWFELIHQLGVPSK